MRYARSFKSILSFYDISRCIRCCQGNLIPILKGGGKNKAAGRDGSGWHTECAGATPAEGGRKTTSPQSEFVGGRVGTWTVQETVA